LRAHAVAHVRKPPLAGLLTDYLRASAGRRFAYGEFDCGLFLADWIKLVRGFDPAAALRGSYHRLEDVPGMHERGGLLHVLTSLARSSGLHTTRHPRLGDVALVSIAGGPVVGAIRGERGWMVLGEGGGLSCVRSARMVKAWAL
jgi:hypothetical protein